MKPLFMGQDSTKKTAKKPKVIGFALDGVLRNIAPSLDAVYRKCFPTRPVNLPVNPYKILDSYYFDSTEEYANFLTTEAITVFGRAAEMYHGVMHEFNKVLVILKQNGYKPVLISREVGKTKPATMFFLAFMGCEIENIRFVSKTEEFWHDVDILVTPNPEVLNQRPWRKRAIKLHKSYNRDVKYVRKINQLKDLPKFLGISEIEYSTTAQLEEYQQWNAEGTKVENKPDSLALVEKSNAHIDEGVVVGDAGTLSSTPYDPTTLFTELTDAGVSPSGITHLLS
jgi:hypothetical protein